MAHKNGPSTRYEVIYKDPTDNMLRWLVGCMTCDIAKEHSLDLWAIELLMNLWQLSRLWLCGWTARDEIKVTIPKTQSATRILEAKAMASRTPIFGHSHGSVSPTFSLIGTIALCCYKRQRNRHRSPLTSNKQQPVITCQHVMKKRQLVFSNLAEGRSMAWLELQQNNKLEIVYSPKLSTTTSSILQSCTQL